MATNDILISLMAQANVQRGILQELYEKSTGTPKVIFDAGYLERVEIEKSKIEEELRKADGN